MNLTSSGGPYGRPDKLSDQKQNYTAWFDHKFLTGLVIVCSHVPGL